MKRCLLCLLCLLPFAFVHAQDGRPPEIPPGTIVEGIIGTPDSLTFDPVYCLDLACEYAAFLFPRFIGVDPATQVFAPLASGNVLASGWEISDDGTEYTFLLRRDIRWSDGTPVTALDVVAALQNSDYLYSYESVSMDALDDYTVRVTFSESACNALRDLNVLVIPAHVDEDPASLSVTAGAYLPDYTDDTWVYLRPNPDFPGAMRGYAFRFVQDEAELSRLLQSGEVDFVRDVSPEMATELQRNTAVRVFEYNGEIWDYVGLNVADPSTLNSGTDSSGSLIDQGHHPLFGDVRVRQALQRALDVNAILNAAVDGRGAPMASFVPAGNPDHHPTLQPVPFNPLEAERLLDEAGFPMGSNGIREARGALYAADGTPFRFTLLTSNSNERRIQAAEIIRQHLAAIGVEVTVETYGFVDLLEFLDTQAFDAYLLSWSSDIPPLAYPEFFLAKNDGELSLNLTSYQNSEVEQLAAEPVANCDPFRQRTNHYRIQEIIQQEQPYLWLYTLNEYSAAHTSLQRFDPLPHFPAWNLHEWQTFQ